MEAILGIVLGVIILIFSAILHEVAHGYVADRLGDPTARIMGRLTLNPLKHIDPYMSILLPVLLFVMHSPILFGGAKPVPIDPFNLKEGKKDVALVALAGPLTNIVLAILASLAVKGAGSFGLGASLWGVILIFILQLVVEVNLYLAIFNLLPIPPLDGSKIFALLLPDREARQYLSLGTVGIVILFMLLAFPIGGFSLTNFIQTIYFYALHLLGMSF